MHAAVGILTARGGMTSHAAVVARGMGRPCVSGAGTLRIDTKAGTMRPDRRTFRKGDIITIDGSTGQVLNGRATMRLPELSGDFATLMGWADAERAAQRARQRRHAARRAPGARLRRGGHRPLPHRAHVLRRRAHSRRARDDPRRRRGGPPRRARQVSSRCSAPISSELFEIMAGLPVTIRLLDPPLHEFLPHRSARRSPSRPKLAIPVEKLQARVSELTEFNPMLGFRGCRLGIALSRDHRDPGARHLRGRAGRRDARPASR